MAHSAKAQREELRRELIGANCSVPQIAAEMAHRFNVRPRVAWRYALGWAQWKVTQEFRVHNPDQPIGQNRVSEWESWPHGGSQPSLQSLAGLARTFGNGCTRSDLVDALDLAHFTESERAYFEPTDAPVEASSTASHASRSTDSSSTLVARLTLPGAGQTPYARRGPVVPSAEVDAGPAADAAARESWWHLATATAAVDPTGIETVHDAIVRLARQYDTLPPSKVLVEARKTRDLAYGLLEQTRRPAQLVNLNLDAGISCALLAVASFDLGQPDASVAQARAAAKYGDVIGHAGLKAWSTGHLSLVAYWSGNPHDAVQIADLALADAPVGSASARLHAIRARAWALIGDRTEVADSLRRADEALASSDGTDDVHDEIGGEFAWGFTRNAMCAGTALVTVGDAAEGANRLRTTIAAAPGTVPRHLVRRSRIDLATAELAAGRFDAAADQLQYVWPTPVDQRRVGLTGRLDGVQNALGDPKWKKYQPAHALKDQITAFTGEAAAHRALLVAGGIASGEIAP